MLKVKNIPIVLNIVSKIKVKPVIEELKANGMFDMINSAAEIKDKEGAKGKYVEIVLALLSTILPNLADISDDLVELIAAYKDVSKEEAGEMDAMEVLKEMLTDTGLMNFFMSAMRSAAQKS